MNENQYKSAIRYTVFGLKCLARAAHEWMAFGLLVTPEAAFQKSGF
jgi:hypothetical protein